MRKGGYISELAIKRILADVGSAAGLSISTRTESERAGARLSGGAESEGVTFADPITGETRVRFLYGVSVYGGPDWFGEG